jgi:hypothetical protein
MQKPTFKTTYPTNQPTFNDWCEEFKVSTRYTDQSPIENAKRIMQLWDGLLKMKTTFKKPLTQNEDI